MTESDRERERTIWAFEAEGEIPDEDLIWYLRKRYTEEIVPPCRICGSPLEIQAMGGGEPTEWGCPGTDDDGGRYKPGRKLSDEHYSASRFTQRKTGDTLVLEALHRLDAWRQHE